MCALRCILRLAVAKFIAVMMRDQVELIHSPGPHLAWPHEIDLPTFAIVMDCKTGRQSKSYPA